MQRLFFVLSAVFAIIGIYIVWVPESTTTSTLTTVLAIFVLISVLLNILGALITPILLYMDGENLKASPEKRDKWDRSEINESFEYSDKWWSAPSTIICTTCTTIGLAHAGYLFLPSADIITTIFVYAWMQGFKKSWQENSAKYAALDKE